MCFCVNFHLVCLGVLLLLSDDTNFAFDVFFLRTEAAPTVAAVALSPLEGWAATVRSGL